MNETVIESNMMSSLKSQGYLTWFKPPSDIIITLLAIFPIIFSQILQRLFPIVDNHFITYLGTQALLIHNIQYSFVYLGQYIGTASATSCLIFWKRSEYVDTQKSIFVIHFGLCIAISLVCLIIGNLYLKNILLHFSIQPQYWKLAKIYLRIGLVNMALQAVYLTMTGIIIAKGKEKLSLIFSVVFLVLNFSADFIAIHFVFSGDLTPSHILPVMLVIILSTTLLLVFSIALMVYFIVSESSGLAFPNIREIFKIWFNELGGAFISGIYPIIYIYQLAIVKSASSLLITYQLLMQVTAVFCIPLLATMQISLRDAAAEKNWSVTKSPQWWRSLFYFGLIPTQIFLILFLMLQDQIIHFVYGYIVPIDHNIYIELYLIGSIIGQFGNAFSVFIRAKKNSHYITICYFICDILVLLGGTQLLIVTHRNDPMMAGVIMFIYTVVYTIINAYYAFRKQKS